MDYVNWCVFAWPLLLFSILHCVVFSYLSFFLFTSFGFVFCFVFVLAIPTINLHPQFSAFEHFFMKPKKIKDVVWNFGTGQASALQTEGMILIQ